MKHTLLIIAFLTLACCSTADAQVAPDDAARRTHLVQALERSQSEVTASRVLIDSLHEQVESKNKLIKAYKEKDEASGAAIISLQAERTNLRAAIVAEEKALSLQKEQVKYLNNQLEKTRGDLKKSRRFAKIFAAIAGVVAIIAITK